MLCFVVLFLVVFIYLHTSLYLLHIFVLLNVFQEVLNSNSYQGFETVLETFALICPVILILPTAEINEGETVTNIDLNQDLISRYPRIIPTLIPEHRILNYKTEIGKVAILRQLRPSLHIEYDHCVCVQVAPFMRVITVVVDGRVDSGVYATGLSSGSGSVAGVGTGVAKSSASAPYSSVGSILELLRAS